MKLASRLSFLLFQATWSFLASLSALSSEPPKAGSSSSLHSQILTIAIIDDFTEIGESQDGITPLVAEDLNPLIEAVIEDNQAIRIFHIVVDEDASDNAIARFEHEPKSVRGPPATPSPSLPLNVLAERVEDYKKARLEWQREIISHRDSLRSDIEKFLRQIAINQLKTSERFDKMLAERGTDFNRSDIVGTISRAQHLLSDAPKSVIVVNSDAKDLPLHRDPRTTPLTKEELNPATSLFFVNTSHRPEQEPLFHGLPNKISHEDSLREAMTRITHLFGRETKKEGP